jgi:endonuclease III
MINPEKITNFNLTTSELEEHLLFWVCAAGKNGRTAAKCLDRLLNLFKNWTRNKKLPIYRSPFKLIRQMNHFHKRKMWLADLMKQCGIGCYNNKSRTFLELVESYFDLQTCSVQDLERIYGIGQKTSRCFILHSRKDAKVAGLDVHILHYMRELGYDAPKTTPTGKKYLKLEQDFLKLTEEAGKTASEFDLEIWNQYSTKTNS